MRTSFAILLLALLPSRGMAQMISPALSPIVHEDRTITFVLLAPEADSVEVITKFREEPFAAVRDTSGLWSVTVGPFAAGTVAGRLRNSRRTWIKNVARPDAVADCHASSNAAPVSSGWRNRAA